MNLLRKKLYQYERHINARKNHLIWQADELQSTFKKKFTSPFGLSSVFLISLFTGLIYRRAKVISPLTRTYKKLPLAPLLSRNYFTLWLTAAKIISKVKISKWLKPYRNYFFKAIF